MATKNIYSDLPKVLYIVSKSDAGEDGAANCPHCGAEGRYVYHFMCDDGKLHGAMRGCFSKFPMHPLAAVHTRILDKIEDYKKKGWPLPSWDADSLKAIENFADGHIGEMEAMRIVKNAEERRRMHLKRRFGRR